MALSISISMPTMKQYNDLLKHYTWSPSTVPPSYCYHSGRWFRHWFICIAESAPFLFPLLSTQPMNRSAPAIERSTPAKRRKLDGSANKTNAALHSYHSYASIREQAISNANQKKRPTGRQVLNALPRFHVKECVFLTKHVFCHRAQLIRIRRMSNMKVYKVDPGRWMREIFTHVSFPSIQHCWRRRRGTRINRGCLPAPNRIASDEPGKGGWSMFISLDVLTLLFREPSNFMPRIRKSWFDYTNAATNFCWKRSDPNKQRSKSYDWNWKGYKGRQIAKSIEGNNRKMRLQQQR